jgi:voltage-gated potassium channel
VSEQRSLSDGQNEAASGATRRRIFEVIFLSDSPSGKLFDIVLLVTIAVSVVVVMVESVAVIRVGREQLFRYAEWVFTLLFTAEYLLRIWCVRRPLRYVTSFYGAVDLLAVLPTYLSLFVTGAGYLLVIRVLRLLRLFRILKLARYVGAADLLLEALGRSRRKIVVFLYAILTIVTICGAMMYLIEGPENGFSSIPRGVYWAIVTLTTVGYGDITPNTVVGQALSAVVMIMGYGIIAVPTGIYAAELRGIMISRHDNKKCPECSRAGHDEDARFCKHCGGNLHASELYKGEG